MFLTFLLFWDASTWGTRLLYLRLDTRYSVLTLAPCSMIDVLHYSSLICCGNLLLSCHVAQQVTEAP